MNYLSYFQINQYNNTKFHHQLNLTMIVFIAYLINGNQSKLLSGRSSIIVD